MADLEKLNILNQGNEAWNHWREKNSAVIVDLSMSNLSGVGLGGFNLSMVNLSGADLSNASFIGANLSGANLSGANLSGANLIGNRVFSVNLIFANLSKANLKHASLMYANLSEANLSEADLSETNLSEVNFSQSKLVSTNLSKAKLVLANLREADISRANLSQANLNDAILCGADLSEADLSGVNLIGANLTVADLGGANLSGADLTNANLTNANLSGADLSGANLLNANLTHADLSGANLSEANLRNAKLIQADLSGVNLIAANLSSTDLSGANLNKANLSNSNLLFANLRQANLTCTNFMSSALIRADLSETDLSEANLTLCNLYGSHVFGANFKKARLTGACIHDWQLNSSTCLDELQCDYIYRTWDIESQTFTERLPVDTNSIFALGEFNQRFRVLASAQATIDLTFTNGIDWQAFFASFQELHGERPEEDISIQGMERKGSTFIIRLEVNSGESKETIESRIKELYGMKLQLQEQRHNADLKAKDEQIVTLYQEQLEFQRQNNTSFIGIIRTMAEKESSKIVNNLHGANIANFANQVNDDARQQANQHIYTSPEKQSLAEAATEIQKLLKILEQTNPTATEVDRQAFVSAAIAPTLQQRAVKALQSGGKTALAEFLDNPYLNVAIAIIEGWRDNNGA
jgi:uncharacterized protein YjbI with pentapeptide repeats